MNNIPSKYENKKMEKLFLAIFFNDLEKVIGFKKQYPEIYAKKEKFRIDKYRTFDLKNLTFFNQSVWKDDDWNDEIIPLIRRNRQRTEQMLDYWRAECSCGEIQREIDYNQYFDYFYCVDPRITDEVFWEPIQDYLSKGIREQDIMLFFHAERFNFKETKKLLEEGAKPDVDICIDDDLDDDDSNSILSRIWVEYLYLISTYVVPDFEAFEINGYKQKFDIKDMFGHLLGLAAHIDMYQLLDAYSEDK